MTEYKAALVRKGFRQADIDDMYDRAKQRLETERKQPTGKQHEESTSMLLIMILR
jgi:hypothetical protein